MKLSGQLKNVCESAVAESSSKTDYRDLVKKLKADKWDKEFIEELLINLLNGMSLDDAGRTQIKHKDEIAAWNNFLQNLK